MNLDHNKGKNKTKWCNGIKLGKDFVTSRMGFCSLIKRSNNGNTYIYAVKLIMKVFSWSWTDWTVSFTPNVQSVDICNLFIECVLIPRLPLSLLALNWKKKNKFHRELSAAVKQGSLLVYFVKLFCRDTEAFPDHLREGLSSVPRSGPRTCWT